MQYSIATSVDWTERDLTVWVIVYDSQNVFGSEAEGITAHPYSTVASALDAVKREYFTRDTQATEEFWELIEREGNGEDVFPQDDMGGSDFHSETFPYLQYYTA